MAYAPLPKLVPIGSPRVPPDETTTAIFMDLLQTQAMKNILTQRDCTSEVDPLEDLNESVEEFIEITPEISEELESVGSFADSDEPIYLPSKGDTDSGIVLHPIKPIMKECGHIEPCETIICDPTIPRYVDSSSPLLLTNIKSSDIDARVTRHCDKQQCDALSIDHNRCRRLVIKLNRCDTPFCDICGMRLKNWKTRVHHRACKRKDEYRHNQVDGAQVLKDRMRERELQMIEDLRIKRRNYVDPEDANEEAAEWLKNNSELDVITTKRTNNPVLKVPGTVLPNIVIPQTSQNLFVNNRTSYEDNLDASLYPEVELLTSPSPPQQQHNQIVLTMPQPAYPLGLNDFTIPGAIPLAPKPAILPFKVVPIAKYQSEPSERDREAGLPKFCIIANNPLQVGSMINIQQIPALQTIAAKITTPQKIAPAPTIKPVPTVKITVPQIITAKITTSNTQPIKPAPSKSESEKNPEEIRKCVKVGKRRGKYKKRMDLKKKPYGCTHCGKRFSAGWYFKEHLDKHKGVEHRVICEICKTVYESVDELTKHMNTQHSDKVTVKDEYSCYNCETNFYTADDMHNHNCVNGSSSNIEILHENNDDDDDVAGDVVDNEMEEIMEIEEENERINGDVKVNGSASNDEQSDIKIEEENNKRLGRRKSKQAYRVDFDMPEEIDVNSTTRKKRKRKC
uniref:C2H2-type domain-containing protein n=1 Tax=Bracon brevicornis TaxID=1563983 RepID=A0A6V7IG33_9HYME